MKSTTYYIVEMDLNGGWDWIRSLSCPENYTTRAAARKAIGPVERTDLNFDYRIVRVTHQVVERISILV